MTVRAKLDRIVDGDTVDVHLMLPVRIRIRNCWAPETRGTEALQGKEASEFLRSRISEDDQLRVHVPTTDADALGDILTFGRVVGDVYRASDGKSIAELMVESGHATEFKE
jgi:endonuclease YncB( thermonuclease family)